MKRLPDALSSLYVIDGADMDVTPLQMLQDCAADAAGQDCRTGDGTIADESLDPEPGKASYSPERLEQYLAAMEGCTDRGCLQAVWAFSATRRAIATQLIDNIWRNGHFLLRDLAVSTSWSWFREPLGNMAAFYTSVQSATDYISSLGLKLSGYSFNATGKANRLDCRFSTDNQASVEETVYDAEDMAPSSARHPETFFAEGLKCPSTIVPDSSGWLLYIPFDTCDFRLGGSLLAEKEGANGDIAPDIRDTEYFKDCFEVIRELVEDGIALAGITVGRGGLALAADRLCNGAGCRMDLSGISNSYGEKDCCRILFGEVPGVIIQIKDIDYDYVDGQFLLQDIAYYPLGHPGSGSITVSGIQKPAISSILASLLSQTSEGED